MAWYQKNTIPEWKLFIDKGYTIQGLLLNKDVVLKDLPQQKEVQNYMVINKDHIVSDILTLCLVMPTPEASYDRKYLFPTKAIELMTNELFFSSLCWDSALIKKYFHELMKNFLTVDHHVQNINLYHAYFERLFRMLTRSAKLSRAELIQAIEQQQRAHGFVCQLMKHAHKYSIVSCFLELLNLDLIDSAIIVSCEIKKEIIVRSLQCLEQYVMGLGGQPQKVEHMLILNKMYLEQSIKYLLGSVPNNDRKVQDFKLIYQIFQTKYHIIPQIIAKQQNCLKMAALQIVQLNEILHIRVRNREIPSLWTNAHREDLITYLFSQRIGLIYPLFIQWLIILFSDIGQSQEKVELLCRGKVFEKVLKVLIEHKANSIVVVRIIQLLKVLFMNIEKDIILSIETNKNVDINRIEFKLFEEFFRHMLTIETTIKQFKSYNELLFTNLIKLIKIYYQYAINIDSIFNHYSALPICQQSRPRIIRLMEFYQKQSCFQLYDHEISKELGTFFDDSILQHIVPLEYQVIKSSQHTSSSNSNTVTVSFSQESTPSQTVSTTTEQQNVPSIIDNTVIEITFNEDLITQAIEEDSTKHISPQPTKNDPMKIQKEMVSANEFNNMQDIQQSYESYMKKKMKQAQQILTEKRSKSRTPTKIKNQLKKSKNRWTSNAEADESNKSLSCENKDIKQNYSVSPAKISSPKECLPAKISIIRLNERRKPKVYRQRTISRNRDQRLQNWLALLKSLR